MLTHPIVRLLSLVLLGWGLLRLVRAILGELGVLVLVVLAVILAAILWALEHDRQRLARLSSRCGPLRKLVELVCRIASKQPPINAETASDGLLPRSADDFNELALRLREEVRGFDKAIDRIVEAIRHQATLRRHAAARSGTLPDLGPLGLFLLVGPDGIGKRHLASRLGKRLFAESAPLILDLEDLADASDPLDRLIGPEGVLTVGLRQSPRRLVLLDHAGAIGPRALGGLLRSLAEGGWSDGRSRHPIHLQGSVWVFSIAGQPKADDLEDVFGIDGLERFQEVIRLRRPSLRVRAEVVALLMARECRRHGITLDYVPPEWIAAEVSALPESFGFATAPARIRRLLRKPLLRATSAGLTRLHLKDEPAKGTAIAS